jgi:hypothetical protein
MASKRELEALIVLAGKVDPSLQKALKDADKKTKQLSATTKLFGNVASKSFTAMKTGVAVGAAALGAAMVYVGKKGLDLASDLTEVQNVVDVTFGASSSLIDTWAKNAKDNFGLSELAAKQYSSTVGAMFKSMGIADQHITGMSTTIAGLSADFASFYNLNPEQAFEKIRSGISGETEPLKQLGINMSVANLEAFALSKGIKTAYSKMGAADQAILRYNYLLGVSADAQGDFARNIDTFANQKRIWATNIQELSAKIMKGAIPSFEKLMLKGNELMQSFMDDPAKMQKVQDAVERFFDAAIDKLPTVISFAVKFAKVTGDIFTIAHKTFKYIQENWGLIKPLLIGIIATMLIWKGTLGVIKLYETYTKAAVIATHALRVAKVKDAAATLYLQGLYAKDAIVKGASTAATWAMNAAMWASPITWIIAGVIALGAGIFLLVKHWDTVKAAMINAWDWFTNLLSKVPDFALILMGPLAPILLLIKHFEKVKELATGAIGAVKKFFGIGKDGDSSDSVKDMPEFARGGFTNRPSIFGEAGPEAAIPLKRTPRSLSLLGKTAQALGVGSSIDSKSGGTPVQFVYSPTYGSGTSESQVRQDFEDFKAMCERWMEERGREEYA